MTSHQLKKYRETGHIPSAEVPDLLDYIEQLKGEVFRQGVRAKTAEDWIRMKLREYEEEDK